MTFAVVCFWRQLEKPKPSEGSNAPARGHIPTRRIAALLDRHTRIGRVLTECPVSTADGVRAADVAWASTECLSELGDKVCFPRAPEICVEVLSPANSDAEIRDKAALYFDAGAKEVWVCSEFGAMTFLPAVDAAPLTASQLCPEFPAQVQLRQL